MEISTTGIEPLIPSNAAYLSSNSKSSTAMSFTISLRKCIAGEAFISTGACKACKTETEYSLNSLSTPGDCLPCQTKKMYWYGGSDVGPKPGYWRSTNTSDNFIACLYAPAWLGYESTHNNSLGEWFEGYQGYLCADCEVGFSRSGDYEWAKCPNPVLNVIKLTLILIAVIIGIVLTVRSTLASALERKNIQSVLIKLLMNHLQLIVLTASFDFQWPSKVTGLFETSGAAAEVSEHIFSFDCFLDKRSDSEDDNLIRLYYQKMIMYALYPLLMALVSAIFWKLYFCWKKNGSKQELKARILGTTIILFFSIHPSIVTYMFYNFR